MPDTYLPHKTEVSLEVCEGELTHLSSLGHVLTPEQSLWSQSFRLDP